MHISNAMIEITRKCNMACDHCLRGDVQKIEIADKYLDAFFSSIDGIGELTITGGEPSLAPHKIEAIIDHAKKHNVSIENFYIATNGKRVSAEFMAALVKLYCYCSDNEMSRVELSNDVYHEDIDGNNVKMLEVFKFFGEKFNSHNDDYEPIGEGRAEENNLGGREIPISSGEYTSIEEFIDGETTGPEAEIYLNCKGNIVFGCNWSFKNQDKKKNIICKVNDLNAETVTAYFQKRFKKTWKDD